MLIKRLYGSTRLHPINDKNTSLNTSLVPSVRTDYEKESLAYRVTAIWNRLPKALYNAKTVKEFLKIIWYDAIFIVLSGQSSFKSIYNSCNKLQFCCRNQTLLMANGALNTLRDWDTLIKQFTATHLVICQCFHIAMLSVKQFVILTDCLLPPFVISCSDAKNCPNKQLQNGDNNN